MISCPSSLKVPRALRSGTVAAAFAVLLASCAGALAQTPARVGVVAAEKKEVSKGADFVGRVDAVEKVDIRARVKGYLQAVKFEEGQAVKVGDPLFEIEPDLFKADVEQAQGALERAKASKTLAEIQLQRAEELLVKQAGTAVRAIRRRPPTSRPEAGCSAPRPIFRPPTSISATPTITSPINGRIGMTNVTAGNVVGPDSGVLATIVSQDPMYVDFPGQPARFLRE